MKLPLAYQHVVNSYTKRSHANNELFRRTRLDKVPNFVALFRKNLRTFKKHVTLTSRACNFESIFHDTNYHMIGLLFTFCKITTVIFVGRVDMKLNRFNSVIRMNTNSIVFITCSTDS